jgi:hypothetical protein
MSHYVKDSIEEMITNRPEIGFGGTAAGVGVSFIESITDVAQMCSALIGLFIGCYTLMTIWKKNKKK